MVGDWTWGTLFGVSFVIGAGFLTGRLAIETVVMWANHGFRRWRVYRWQKANPELAEVQKRAAGAFQAQALGQGEQTAAPFGQYQ